MQKEFLLKLDDCVKSMYAQHSTFHEGDAGVDLFIKEDVEILGGETKLVDLGVSSQLREKKPWYLFWRKPKYFSYLLVPRSSIYKTTLMMKNSVGLIDQSYTGNLKVPLFNTSEIPCTLKGGERYVQLVAPDLDSVSLRFVDSLRNTSRGQAGFGSTGK